MRKVRVIISRIVIYSHFCNMVRVMTWHYTHQLVIAPTAITILKWFGAVVEVKRGNGCDMPTTSFVSECVHLLKFV